MTTTPSQPANDPTTRHADPDLHVIEVNGIRLAYAEWRAELRGAGRPTLLLCHATGFHGRVWDRMLTLLPDWHAIAVDLRGHGRSETTPITNWVVFGRDIADLVRRLDLHHVVGIGHSMGAHTLVRAAAVEQARFDGLFLFDPTILPREAHRPGLSFDVGDHPVSRRNRRFASALAMRERFADRPPYASFDPQVLADYCTHGLVPAADGDGFELACRPETEASIYLSSRADDTVYDAIPRIDLPVLIARAKLPVTEQDRLDFSFSPTWPELASAFKHARDLHFAERNHLMPLESPAQTAALINEFVRSLQQARPAEG
ncbi:MAG: alpha/beta hydrolase [Burkholderiaceae bacterium]